MAAEKLITEHLDLWTAAIKRKSSASRGSSSKLELYGIKKLRELILELAVRGLLVPQDAKDEPASELLKRIASEKAKLVKVGKIKKDKPLQPVAEKEKSFELPSGWQWAKLGMLMEMFNGRAFSQTEWSSDGLPIIRIQNLNDECAPFNYFNGDVSENNYIEPGTFLISWSGTPGTSFGAFIWGGAPGVLNQHINKCMIFGEEISKQYLLLAVNSCMDHLIEYAQGGVGLKHVTKGTLNNCVFAVPPLAEQHRIVAKVDALMVLCDQLEKHTDTSLSAHQSLVEALLSGLTVAADHAQFASAWQRIAEHFDTLFTTEESIDQLKQTILQLAVTGKLVPQDPKDEPASELLKKIAAEKAKLLKNGRFRGSQAFSPVAANERPHQSPQGWEWVRLGDCGIASTGKTPSTKEAEYFVGDIPFIGPGQVSPQGNILKPDKFLSQAGLEESTEALPGDVLMVCIGGSIGKAAIADKKLAFNQQINAIRPINISSKYLYFAFSTELFYASVLRQASGSATPIINRSKWEDLLVPLSPKAEQYRIVEKVSELMTICNRLKLHINDASKAQLNLADAMAETALSEA